VFGQNQKPSEKICEIQYKGEKGTLTGNRNEKFDYLIVHPGELLDKAEFLPQGY
jgi:hypothetical protein